MPHHLRSVESTAGKYRYREGTQLWKSYLDACPKIMVAETLKSDTEADAELVHIDRKNNQTL
jgi:hypothetical protein